MSIGKSVAQEKKPDSIKGNPIIITTTALIYLYLWHLSAPDF